MSTFLFTAVNRDGKSVTERVEAENLSQARYILEIRGYSEILFYESELSKETDRLFDEKKLKDAQKQYLENQVSVQYDTSITRHFLNLLKVTWVFWALIIGAFLFVQNTTTFLLLTASVVLTVYISLPVIIFNRLFEAHGWDRNRQVRLLANIAKWFNYISYGKIPLSEIDTYLSCADAREGKIDQALRRMTKYQNDSKVSKRLYNSSLIRIYGNARDFDKVLELLEDSLNEGNNYNEKLLDYAICLARRYKQTTRARSVLERLFEAELSAMGNLFIPYCQGVIEVEDGNYSQAEFYLRQASKQLEPFRKNTYLIGLKSEVKAFLAMTLGRQGEKDEAERLLEEAKPYLAAVNERELLQRCEDAVS